MRVNINTKFTAIENKICLLKWYSYIEFGLTHSDLLHTLLWEVRYANKWNQLCVSIILPILTEGYIRNLLSNIKALDLVTEKMFFHSHYGLYGHIGKWPIEILKGICTIKPCMKNDYAPGCQVLDGSKFF